MAKSFSISGRLLHDPFKSRGAELFWNFPLQKAHQSNVIDCDSDRHMAEMRFAQTDIPRTA
jgi:hypothetical protein